jgi:hypothetical protein
LHEEWLKMRPKSTAHKPEIEQEGLLPAGAPDWVTEDLIIETLETWQPYYNGSLTVEDALEILIGVTKLFEIIHET